MQGFSWFSVSCLFVYGSLGPADCWGRLRPLIVPDFAFEDLTRDLFSKPLIVIRNLDVFVRGAAELWVRVPVE